MSEVRSAGMAWYDRASYARIRAVMTDGHRLPESYGAWLLSSEQVESELERAGVKVVRAAIEPDEFLAWCAARGLAPDGKARSQFATEAANRTAGDVGAN